MTFLQTLKQLHPLFLIISIACVIASSYLIAVLDYKKSNIEHIVDYTNCTNEENIMCNDYPKYRIGTCICLLEFNLTDNFNEPIIAYYELESFNQLDKDYVNSKDDNQLQGILNSTPSVNCEPYRYDDKGKPIAPCGRIADTFFNDTFNIRHASDEKYLPYSLSGILADHEKKKFRNPDNITEAKLNFAKPTNWRRSIWELDTSNTENNGFQNELFIGWMNTELKRKPRARFTEDLPSGSYVLRVSYFYPSSIYNGPRKFIITSQNVEYYRNPLYDCILIISLVVFLLYIITSVVIYVKNRIQKRKKQDAPSNGANNENTTSLM